MKICQFCKIICSGERGLSIHMYQSFECFQKLTDFSKKYHNYSLIHTQAKKLHILIKIHQRNNMQLIKIKSKNIIMLLILLLKLQILILNRIIIIIAHQYMIPVFSINKLNSITESKISSK